MSHALVVYESVFGDARAIALAIADGLSASLTADAVPAGRAPTEIGSDVALMVVGGPAALGMPKPATRESAVRQYGADVPDPAVGLREWLEAVRVRSPVCRPPRSTPDQADTRC